MLLRELDLDVVLAAKDAADVEVNLTLPGILALVAGALIIFAPTLLRWIVGGYLLAVGFVQIFDITLNV